MFVGVVGFGIVGFSTQNWLEGRSSDVEPSAIVDDGNSSEEVLPSSTTDDVVSSQSSMSGVESNSVTTAKANDDRTSTSDLDAGLSEPETPSTRLATTTTQPGTTSGSTTSLQLRSEPQLRGDQRQHVEQQRHGELQLHVEQQRHGELQLRGERRRHNGQPQRSRRRHLRRCRSGSTSTGMLARAYATRTTNDPLEPASIT